MNIHSIEQKKIISDNNTANVEKISKQTLLRQDEALFSSEAKEKYHSQKLQYLENIQQKISQGWYLQKFVSEKVASSLISSGILS